jgi:hypothetical protein
MIARVALGVLAALVAAAPARAAVPLARSGSTTSVALAGETALFLEGQSFHLRVLSVPVDGSARAEELIRLSGAEDGGISASAQRVAFELFGPRDAYVLTGPPAGPFTKAPASPGAGSAPYYATVNHDVLFTVEEAPGDPFAFRHVVIEPGAAPRALGLPGDADTLAYDGDLIAYNTGDTNVTVHNWRTGADRVITLFDPPDRLDVRADGAVVASTHAGIYTVAPDGPPLLLSRTGESAQFAGARIVYLGGSRQTGVRQLIAVEPGGRPRKIGVPSARFGTFVADAERVLWTANGCVLAAELSAPLAAAPGHGPCVRTEVAVIGYDATIRRDGTVPVRLRCVAAPRACRGTLHLDPPSTTVRFSIPAGGRKTLMPRLTGVVRRDADLFVHAITVDPGGRHTEYTGGLKGKLR